MLSIGLLPLSIVDLPIFGSFDFVRSCQVVFERDGYKNGYNLRGYVFSVESRLSEPVD